MYKQGEIVLVPFPYSDLSASKRRPALVVVSNNLYNGRFPDIVVCVITSNLYKDNSSVEPNDNNLQSGILPESPIIICHNLFTIEQSRIIKKFSKVKDDKLKEVISMLHNLFQN